MSGIILDVAVVVVTVLLLIFGIWRGMYKLIFGVISALLGLVLAIVLLSPVTTFITDKTLLDERLTAAIDQPLSEALPNNSITIALYDIDGDSEANELGFLYEDKVHPFSDALEGSPYALFSGVIENLVSKHVDENTTDITYISVLSSVLVSYIVAAIVFVALLIVMSIIVALIMRLIKKFVTHTYLGHFVDKLLGAVLGLVISAIVIWGSLAIIRVFGRYDWIIPVNNLINGSKITKILYDNNIIYNLLIDVVDLQKLFDSVFAGSANSAPPSTEAVRQVVATVNTFAVGSGN